MDHDGPNHDGMENILEAIMKDESNTPPPLIISRRMITLVILFATLFGALLSRSILIPCELPSKHPEVILDIKGVKDKPNMDFIFWGVGRYRK